MNHAADVRAVIVLTTLGADADAVAFGRLLVEAGVAACVSVLPPMTSIYRWKGSVNEDREQQLMIKTTHDCIALLETRLREIHPYELPEFLVIPIEGGSSSYLGWLQDSTGPATSA